MHQIKKYSELRSLVGSQSRLSSLQVVTYKFYVTDTQNPTSSKSRTCSKRSPWASGPSEEVLAWACPKLSEVILYVYLLFFFYSDEAVLNPYETKKV